MNEPSRPRLRHLALTAVALLAAAVGATGPAAATVVLVGGVGARSRGMAGLVGWIGGGALLGGAIGYAADALVTLPLATAGAIGLGIALGGGLGGISHLLSTEDPATADDEQVTVDMASQSTPEPRPADLFDEHPDPLLYVADAGGGPVVRAANDAYERAFDLPAATIEDAPLGDVLVVEDGPGDGEGGGDDDGYGGVGDEGTGGDGAGGDGAGAGEAGNDTAAIVDRVSAGERVDAVFGFETPEGTRPYRVRSVGAAADGYLLFTPVEGDRN